MRNVLRRTWFSRSTHQRKLFQVLRVRACCVRAWAVAQTTETNDKAGSWRRMVVYCGIVLRVRSSCCLDQLHWVL
jgi:hypothetical protein